jgi:hypothetical protein
MASIRSQIIQYIRHLNLFLGEDLKGSRGNEDWLRFFQLMSGEVALAERCPEGSLLPSYSERVKEILNLSEKLSIDETFENLGNAVRGIGQVIRTNDRMPYYLISYDYKTREVEISPYSKPIDAVNSYDQAEFHDSAADERKKNIVLVEADKIDGLRAAYPNYFGDVHLFRTQLNRIVSGKGVREYNIKPLTVRPSDEVQVPDLSWFRRSRFRRSKWA